MGAKGGTEEGLGYQMQIYGKPNRRVYSSCGSLSHQPIGPRSAT
jgi:hypothetical protein